MGPIVARFFLGFLALALCALIFWMLDWLDVFLLFVLIPIIVLYSVEAIKTSTYEAARAGLKDMTTNPIRRAVKAALTPEDTEDATPAE